MIQNRIEFTFTGIILTEVEEIHFYILSVHEYLHV